MNRVDSSFYSIEQVANQYLPKNSKAVSSPSDQITSFTDILSQKYDIEANKNSTVHFSKHAMHRLDQRNITLSAEQESRLSDGVMKAGEKGIQDSLVLVDQLAFIVNVPSQTVVTAMDQAEDSNIFTNIDGAVIA